MEPGADTPHSPAQPMALPGFAFVTPSPAKRSRRRYIPVAVASVVAFFLFYGVMEENQLTRVSVAERAQVDDVRIDPDRLPAALVQYPATVTGQMSDGLNVPCTIHSLHDKEGPSCVIPPRAAPIPRPQVHVEAGADIAPPTGAVTPTPGRADVPATKSPPVTAATAKPVVDDRIGRREDTPGHRGSDDLNDDLNKDGSEGREARTEGREARTEGKEARTEGKEDGSEGKEDGTKNQRDHQVKGHHDLAHRDENSWVRPRKADLAPTAGPWTSPDHLRVPMS